MTLRDTKSRMWTPTHVRTDTQMPLSAPRGRVSHMPGPPVGGWQRHFLLCAMSDSNTKEKSYKDEATLRHLYHERGLSLQGVGDELGVSDQCILRWMRELGVTRRTKSESCARRRPDELNSSDWLKEKYWGEGLTTPEMAEEVGVSKTSVQDAMDREGVPRRPRAIPDGHPVNDSGLIQRKYCEQGMTAHELSDWLMVKVNTLLARMDEFGIERRDRTRANAQGNVDPLYNECWVWKNYVVQQRSVLDIAEELGVSGKPVRAWVKKHGFRLRGLVESHSSGRTDLLRDREWMNEAYVGLGMSSYQIADRIGSSRSVIVRWLRKHGVQLRQAGVNQSSGESKDYDYGPSWTRARRRVLQRDGYECRRCDLPDKAHQDEYDEGLHVHHIVPLHAFANEDDVVNHEVANHPDNLITLCKPCHFTVEEKTRNKDWIPSESPHSGLQHRLFD